MNKILDQTLLNSVNIFDGLSDLNFSSVESITRVFSYYDDGLEQPSVCILLERSSTICAVILRCVIFFLPNLVPFAMVRLRPA